MINKAVGLNSLTHAKSGILSANFRKIIIGLPYHYQASPMPGGGQIQLADKARYFRPEGFGWQDSIYFVQALMLSGLKESQFVDVFGGHSGDGQRSQDPTDDSVTAS
jgi:hypothetical protein